MTNKILRLSTNFISRRNEELMDTEYKFPKTKQTQKKKKKITSVRV